MQHLQRPLTPLRRPPGHLDLASILLEWACCVQRAVRGPFARAVVSSQAALGLYDLDKPCITMLKMTMGYSTSVSKWCPRLFSNAAYFGMQYHPKKSPRARDTLSGAHGKLSLQFWRGCEGCGR